MDMCIVYSYLYIQIHIATDVFFVTHVFDKCVRARLHHYTILRAISSPSISALFYMCPRRVLFNIKYRFQLYSRATRCIAVVSFFISFVCKGSGIFFCIVEKDSNVCNMYVCMLDYMGALLNTIY